MTQQRTYLPPVVVYADDPDPVFERQITGRAPIDFTPVVLVGGPETSIVASWLGAPGLTRILQVPVSTLPSGAHRLYLRVPGDSDLDLGYLRVVTRA